MVPKKTRKTRHATNRSATSNTSKRRYPLKKTGLPQWLRDEVEPMTCAETRLELEHKAEPAGTKIGTDLSLTVAALMCGRSGKVALAVPQVNFLNSLRARVMARVRPFCQRAGYKKSHWRIVPF